jgi:uncharacterized protein (TIGR02117 family)
LLERSIPHVPRLEVHEDRRPILDSSADPRGVSAAGTAGRRATRQTVSARGPWLALPAALVAGCLSAIPSLYPPEDPRTARPVFVVQHGWHTRIAVRRADVSPHAWPESDDLGEALFLEVGWGDAAFYQSDDATVAQAINAVVRPTPSALHVAAFRVPLTEALPGRPIVQVDLSPGGFERLTTFIHESYAHDADGRPIRTRPGRYPQSAFYLATGRYHAFNTSNTWTASALRAAGAPVTPAYAVFAWNVMSQASRIGRRLDGAGARVTPPARAPGAMCSSCAAGGAPG